MGDLSANLGFSAEMLQRMGDAFEGFAVASGIKLREEGEGDELIVGSCYVVAAIYRSLLDAGLSIPLFGIAAGIYRRQDHSFWKPLSICGLNREWLFGQAAGSVEGDPPEFFYELLRQYFLFNSGDENALGRMLEYAASAPALLAFPIGNPPIPLYDYIAFIRGDIEKVYYNGDPAHDGDHTWAAALRVLLQRSAEQLQLAQRNRLRWANEIGVLPYEPEVLAVVIGFCIRNRNRTGIRQFAEKEEAARDGSPAVFLVRLALEIVVASR